MGESCRATGDCEAPLSCIAEVCVDAESGSTTDGDADPDGGAVSNVAACEQFSEAFDCGGVDLAGQLDCAQLGQIACDLGEYFECLEEHTGCHDGQADTKEWVDCAKLLECTAEDTASDGNPGESEEACQRFVDSFECGDFDITD